MATRSKSTFQKRQKEMKRQEKARMKAERRAQKKLMPRTEGDDSNEILISTEDAIAVEGVIVPSDSEPQI